jgi:hypothetical protein
MPESRPRSEVNRAPVSHRVVAERRRGRRTFTVLMTAALLGATALMGVALAQPRGRPAPKPKPKPNTTVDAEAPAADDTSGVPVPGSQAPAGASTFDGGVIPPPQMRPDLGDGGVKMSPLNPTAPEMPPLTPTPAGSAAVDYDKLLGDIAALRARVAAVGDSLFVARIALAVETDGNHAKVGRMVVSLDDGVVYTAPANFRADDPATIYDHAVAPGRHAVTVDVDRRDDRDETFKDAQHARFIVDVPPDNKLNVTLRLGDDSNMGGFPSDKSGKYDIRIRIKAAAVPVKR